MNLILKLKVAMGSTNLTFVPYNFVAHFVSYISAKYYLNWFSFYNVIIKVIGGEFFLKHCVYRSVHFITSFVSESSVKRMTTLPSANNAGLFDIFLIHSSIHSFILLKRTHHKPTCMQIHQKYSYTINSWKSKASHNKWNTKETTLIYANTTEHNPSFSGLAFFINKTI